MAFRYKKEGYKIVRLTEEGEEKVGRRTIYSTDDQIQYRGFHIVVTDRKSGRTYILAEDDIEFIDQEEGLVW